MKSAFHPQARWLSAPDCLLEQVPARRDPLFPQAPFLCGKMYIRQHLRRLFDLEAIPASAVASFTADFKFDLFCNGEPVVEKVRESGEVDMRPFLNSGQNFLMLRLYQTDTPDGFTLAVTGGLRLAFKDGATQDILTDDAFVPLWLATFWEEKEAADFLTNPECGRPIRRYCGSWHPRALRRSLLFRRPFEVRADLLSARLQATANCMACFSLDGEPLDDGVLQPGATEKRREYREYDLTTRLAPGEHVLGAVTGNGWTNCASWGTLHCHRNGIIASLILIYIDGTVEEVLSDTNGRWHVALSPLTENDLQFGERYDARLEEAGWDRPGFKADGRWVPAAPLPEDEAAAVPPLVLQAYPPIRAVRTWRASLLRELPAGSFPAEDSAVRAWLYDVKQTIAGTIRLTLRNLHAGQKVGFFFCERLTPDGLPETCPYGGVVYPQDARPAGISPFNLRGYSQYIAAGRPVETYTTRFTYTGFRYVVVTGLDAPLDDEGLVALELHNDLTPAGTFACGAPALMHIVDCTRQSWENNCFNGPTDCPTREKNFWNGDTQIFSHAACWLSDCRDFLGNWTRYGRKMEPNVYGWEDETYVLPYVLYRFYGDKSVLEDCFPAMMELVERRREHPDMLLPEKPRSPYNDWLNPTGVNLTPLFFSACWYLRMLSLVAEIAEIIGREDVASRLRGRFDESRAAFLERYFSMETARFKEDIQCAYVFGLAFNIVPGHMRTRCLERLVELIHQEGHQTTGFHGTRFLFDVLSEGGYAHLAVKLLLRNEFPSWGDMLQGLTTIPESWRGNRDPDRSLSMSHFSYGACVAWFFEYLGGIRVDESAPGLKRLVLRPHALRELGFCNVAYKTPWGEVRVSWKFDGDTPSFDYVAPEGVEVDFQPEVIP